MPWWIPGLTTSPGWGPAPASRVTWAARLYPAVDVKVTVRISPGSHSSEEAINKQLADKERVAAALENTQLLAEVDKCTAGTDRVDTSLVRLLL